MSPLELALIAALFCLVSGIPALWPHIPLFTGRRISCGLMVAGALAGLAAALNVLLAGARGGACEMAWRFPMGEIAFRLDPLSAFFLIPLFIVSTCISLYGCGYCSTTPENRGESLLTFYFGATAAAIVMLLLAANGITLLLFWEAMALGTFLAICLEHNKPEVLRAGLHYLVASHATTISLFALVALLPRTAGSLFPAAGSLDPTTLPATAIFAITLVGFGIKAGIMPLHVWLPGAHANAPSNISALMSGIVLKLGIYGLIRVLSFFASPPLWWGLLFLCLGIVSAVAGVLFAIGQHDIKRLLAYHSIENIGIIVMAMGVALCGLATGNRILFVLGQAAALLHVINHALFKSLLFLGAGIVVHGTGTRNIDRMGGLARALPVTSAAFLAGSVAICGLPPLNGFVSEFLLYLGMFTGFDTSPGSTAAFLALAVPALALTGGLALACFVKVYGTVFLGMPRTPLPHHREHPATTTAMACLAACCLLIGVLPFGVTRILEPVIAACFPQRDALLPSIQTTANLAGLSMAAAILILAICLLAAFYINRLKSQPVEETGTWDCGYAAPTTSMQYSASSLAATLVGIFGAILRPERHEPATNSLFPGPGRFESHIPEVVLDKGLLPFLSAVDRHLGRIRRLQNGQLNHYILYIFIALLVALALSCFY
ncbi:proton-conducting transporter membrane subunit [Geobacter sp. AOG2]|uniref:proton-conducting transporter transmembrane domain-containing protein n=1 Tax=Geobacter sp. AOG2 TaxID=1566347 RepID=UPI001CC5B450|nr:proton-conducting transporter membrane subunit [Geobacter sp. AOG2]GFE62710.1 hydrogenase [Geobacter sp. AOG2]